MKTTIDSKMDLIAMIAGLSPVPDNNPDYFEGYCDAICDAVCAVESSFMPKTGYWIVTNRIKTVDPFHDAVVEVEIEEKCSQCGRFVCRDETDAMDAYCPTCGARMMDEVEEGKNHSDVKMLRETVDMREKSEYIDECIKEIFGEEET